MAKISSTDLDVYPLALASGFLTGKYRPGEKVASQRAERAGGYLNEKGVKVLAALHHVAAAQNEAMATIALAWLAAQPTVVAPIASARTPSARLRDTPARFPVRFSAWFVPKKSH
jgi:aryl-alcohol dehydrogenase-like predicted oxidoreductase